MSISLELHYPDGSDEHLRLRTNIKVDALPPVGTLISMVGNRFTVSKLFLDVRGNGDALWAAHLAPIID